MVVIGVFKVLFKITLTPLYLSKGRVLLVLLISILTRIILGINLRSLKDSPVVLIAVD